MSPNRLDRGRHDSVVRSERLLEITEAIAEAVSREEVFAALVDRVFDTLGASSAGLWLLDADASTARLVRSRGYSESARQRIELLPMERSPALPVLDCMRSGESVWIPSQAALLDRYPHLGAVTTPGRAYRVACLPLGAPGKVLGSLGFTIEEPREETEDEREFMLLVARYATQAVERLRLLDAERRSRDAADAAATRLQVLSRVSRAFAESSLELPIRLRELTVELARALEGCVNIALLESDGFVHLAAVAHPEAEAQQMLLQFAPSAPLCLGEGITGRVAATGESVLLSVLDPNEFAAQAPEAYRAFLARHPIYALMAAALRVRGRVIGAVTATRCRPGETYTPQDLGLLEELAERAAVAIENSRLYEESLEGRKRAQQLYGFAQSVVSAERVESVFAAALAAVQGAFDTPRSAILTFDEQGVMRFRAWQNLSDDYRRTVEGHSPWPRHTRLHQAVLVPDAQRDAELAAYAPLFLAEGIGALAFIPLVTRGRLLGKFVIYYDRPHSFTQSELETARAIANHLASVIARFSAVATLEDTIRQNELFAGVLAHDLRNPLSAMMTAAQILLLRSEREGNGQERETKPLHRILTSGQRMSTMIEQLLDFTRVRSGGGIPVEPREANLADLCAQAVGEIELAHPEWRIERTATGDQGGRWDADRLLQIFSNLIGNACQHGCQESPVRVNLDGTNRHDVAIEVHNGGAIPEALLPNLFDPFRSTRHGRGNSSGLGLGLFIVREIVRGHEGTVDVTSTASTGTHIVIRLPRHTQPKSETELRSPWRLS